LMHQTCSSDKNDIALFKIQTDIESPQTEAAVLEVPKCNDDLI
jgi:hypothetical protein